MHWSDVVICYSEQAGKWAKLDWVKYVNIITQVVIHSKFCMKAISAEHVMCETSLQNMEKNTFFYILLSKKINIFMANLYENHHEEFDFFTIFD